MNCCARCTHTRRLTSGIVALLLSLQLLALAPAVAWAQDGAPSGGLSAEEQHILGAVNAARAEAGLSLLAENSLLSQAAQTQADDIAYNYVYSHWGSDGSSVAQRVARTGYAAYPAVSENWVSSSGATAAMQWWMNDYIHRANILTAKWLEIGVGVTAKSSGEIIFVTVFSAGRDEGTVIAAAAPEQSLQQAPVQAAAAVPAPAAQPVAVPAAGLDYVVQSGDTLLGIALRHGMDWPEVATANGLQEQSLLQVGQTVHIPGSGEAVGASGTGGPVAGFGKPYAVQPDETLFSIAARNGLTWQELAAFNGMGENDYLQIDQVIQLPVALDVDPAAGAATQEEAAVVSASADTETASSAATGAATSAGTGVEPAVEPASAGAPVVYTMQEGDTIFGVALTYGVDWLAVLSLNGLTENSLIQPGQQIRLR